MAEVGITAFKASASAVIEAFEAGTSYVVTKRGRPAAVLLPIDEAEDVVLAHADAYLLMRRPGRAAYTKGRGISLGTLG